MSQGVTPHYDVNWRQYLSIVPPIIFYYTLAKIQVKQFLSKSAKILFLHNKLTLKVYPLKILHTHFLQDWRYNS